MSHAAWVGRGASGAMAGGLGPRGGWGRSRWAGLNPFPIGAVVAAFEANGKLDVRSAKDDRPAGGVYSGSVFLRSSRLAAKPEVLRFWAFNASFGGSAGPGVGADGATKALLVFSLGRHSAREGST